MNTQIDKEELKELLIIEPELNSGPIISELSLDEGKPLIEEKEKKSYRLPMLIILKQQTLIRLKD